MATKKQKGLGRGLEALLGPKASEPDFIVDGGHSANSSANGAGLPTSLYLTDLVPGQYQPRKLTKTYT